MSSTEDRSETEHSIARESRTVAKTLDGRLPESLDTKLYAGHGTNVICSGCDEKITADEVECETDHTDTVILRFHAACYRAWKSGGTRSTEQRLA
jgi:hypothetical protein